jgi:2-oxoglutarate dehydrogenase E1 component
VLERLNAGEAFESFLQTKFVGQKRFSLEGAESLIPLLDGVLQRAAEEGLDEVAIGMPHRGRLNVLANIVGKSYAQIFREFEGNIDPRTRTARAT